MDAKSDISVYVEHYDDISIGNDNEHELFQIKQSNSPKNITDNSIEFWKTLGNWSHDLRKGKVILEKSKFVIITMNNAKTDSIMYFLKPEIHKYLEAKQRIEEIGKSSGNDDIKNKYYPEFTKLDPVEQIELIKKISVLDNAPSLTKIKEDIKFIIKGDTDDDFVVEYYTHLYGWWKNKIMEILDSREPIPITWSEIRQVRKKLSDRYRKEVFLTSVTKDETDKIIPTLSEKTFVKQLRVIDKNPRAIEDAKSDYAQARRQHLVWIEENPSTDGMIEKYKKKLIHNYTTKFNSDLDKIPNTITTKLDNELLKKWGQDMYDWAMFNTNWNIHADVDEFVKRGTLHELADIPEIGWHPKYEEELERLK